MYMTYLTRRIFSKRVLRLVPKMNLYKASLKSTLLPSNHHSNLSNTDAHEAPSFPLQDTVCMMTNPSLSLVFLLKSPNASCYKIKLRYGKLTSRVFHIFSKPPPQEKSQTEPYITHSIAKSSAPATSKSLIQHSDGRDSDILKLQASGQELSFGYLCLPSAPSFNILKRSGACALSGACTLVSLN